MTKEQIIKTLKDIELRDWNELCKTIALFEDTTSLDKSSLYLGRRQKWIGTSDALAAIGEDYRMENRSILPEWYRTERRSE